MERKKRNKFSAVAVVLVLAMVAASLMACGKTNTPTGDNSTTAAPAAAAASTTVDPLANYHAANVPKQDYGGVTINFLVSTISGPDWTQWVERDLTAENETGDTINDAVYKRNSIISTDYNVQFAEKDDTNYTSTLQKMVKSGAQDYDIAFTYVIGGNTDAQKGLYENLYNVPDINLTQPWYNQNSIAGLSMAHYLPFVQSDLLVKPNDAVTAMIFNKAVVQEYNMGDMYQLVSSGQWTLDKLTELASQVHVDLNGDGQMYIKDDKFGLITQADSLTSFMHGSDCAIAKNDPTTNLPVPSFDNQKTYDVLNKAWNLMLNGQWSVSLHLYENKFPIYDWQVTMFEAGNACFSWIRMIIVEQLRGMDADFGILPIPKYDTNQADYYCEMNPHTSNAMGIPMSNQNMARTGTIIEAMTSLSRDILQPAYYDINLNGKVVRDSQSSAMLDVIFAHEYYDPGQIYDFGGLYDSLIQVGRNKASDFASMYAKASTKMQTSIDKVVNIFTNLANQ